MAAAAVQPAWATWTPDDVASWLQERGLPQYSEAFRRGEVDGPMLVEQLAFREDLLAKMLGVSDPMHRAKIIAHAKHLRTGSQRMIAGTQQRVSAAARSAGLPPSVSAAGLSATPASPITLSRFVDIVQGSGAGGAESGDEDREVSVVPVSPLQTRRVVLVTRPAAHVARKPGRGGAKPIGCRPGGFGVEDRARSHQARKLAKQQLSQNYGRDTESHPPLAARASVTSMYGTWHETSKFSGPRYESSFGLDSVSYSRKGSIPGAGKQQPGRGMRQTMLGPASPDHPNIPGPMVYKESFMDWHETMPKSARATIGLSNRRAIPLFHRSNQRMERNLNSEPVNCGEGDEQNEWSSLHVEDYEDECVEKMT